MGEDETHYIVEAIQVKTSYENSLPIYNKVIENEYLRLYRLAKKVGGRLIRFKTDAESEIAAVAKKKILFWIVPFHGFCTFGSGTPNSVVLGDSRRSACSAARLTS